MIHHFNSLDDIVNQIIKLYMELNRIAEYMHDMGPQSGAKRTILISVFRKKLLSSEELLAEYPMSPLEGKKIIKEMLQDSYIETIFKNRQIFLSLTSKGEAKLKEVLEVEAKFMQQSGKSLPLSDLKDCAETLKLVHAFIKNHGEPDQELAAS